MVQCIYLLPSEVKAFIQNLTIVFEITILINHE